MAQADPVSKFGWEFSKAEHPRSVAELAKAGVTPGMLRGPGWRRVARGFYVPATSGAPSVGQRIAEIASLICSAGVIAGWAAGYIHGAHWLDGRDHLTFDLLPIDCIGPRRVHQPGLRYRRTALAPSDVCMRRDMAVTTPLRTAFDGARWAGSLEDAVLFVDAMAKHAGVDLTRLADYALGHPRLSGVQQVRTAVRLGNAAVLSPYESILRVCYRCQAGLPEPLLNVPLFDGEIFLGQPDLFDPDAAFAMEFDGDLHRDREQHRRDNIGEEKLESAGVTGARGGSIDLMRHRADLIRRMQDGHHRGMSRDRSRDRWTLTQPEWWRHR